MKLKALTPNLMVENVANTAAYFEDLLGFKIINSVDDNDGGLVWTMIQKDEILLMLEDKKSLSKDIEVFKDIGIGASLTLYLSVEGIDDIYEQVKDKVDIISEPKITFYGNKEFVFIDLNGYVFNLSERVQQ